MTASADSNGTAADRLRRAVSAATAGKGSRDELQEAARALVSELRGRDQAPEQMLVQIKSLLADAGLRAGFASTDPGDSLGDESALYRDIITWSIRCYYEDGKRSSS
ncbi:MAG TPA: hypothetical protein VGM50_22045 [Gemmatimonadaceae bacterium]|jgi:signal transduction histidine kinase